MGQCFLDGITRSEFSLDQGTWVVVDRTGIHVDAGTQRRDTALAGNLFGCHHVTWPIVHTTVAVQRESTTSTRHFLQVFTWLTARIDGHIVRDLQWILMEIVRTEVQVVASEQLARVVDSPYPAPHANQDIADAVALRPVEGGHVEWEIKGRRTRRGAID